MGFDFGWTKLKTYLQLAGGGNTAEMVCLSAGVTNRVPAYWRSVGFVSIVYAKGENSASITGPTAGKPLTDTPAVEFKNNMAKGFLIAVECITYMVSVPWPTVRASSWHRTGHKLSFERRRLHLMVWQSMSGRASARGCMIVLVACQFSCVPRCITPKIQRKQAVGVNAGLAVYLCQGKLLYFPCGIPLLLVTEYPVVTFACTCLLMTSKNQKRGGGERKEFTSRTAMQVLQYAMVQTWKPGRHI